MATVTRTRMTAEEFLARDWPDRHVQLIDGEVVVTEPTAWHQLLVKRMVKAVDAWTDAAPGRGLVLANVAARLGEHDVPVPDVLWWAHDVPVDWNANAQDRPPTLGVEVRSPSTWRYDVGRKRTLYERGGMRELWLVDTESESVIVHRRSELEGPELDVALEVRRGETLVSPWLPGFELAVEALFAPAGQ